MKSLRCRRHGPQLQLPLQFQRLLAADANGGQPQQPVLGAPGSESARTWAKHWKKREKNERKTYGKTRGLVEIQYLAVSGEKT